MDGLIFDIVQELNLPLPACLINPSVVASQHKRRMLRCIGIKTTMRKIRSLLFPIVFYLGALVGFLLTGMATWADIEAVSYGFPHTGEERLGTLYCPILMTKNEIGTFAVKVSNTTDKKLAASIRTDITTRFDPVSSYTSVELAPGEAERVEWKIGPENLKLEQFIFVRASVNAYPLPSRESICGIFVVDLPANGNVVMWTMVGLSLLGMGVGLYGVRRSQSVVHNSRADMMRFNALAVLITTGVLTSFMGWWLLGIVVIVLSVLLIIISISTVRR